MSKEKCGFGEWQFMAFITVTSIVRKLGDIEESRPSLLLETMCFRMEKAGWPNRWYHSDEEVLMLENAISGDDTGHS